jgi:hypothetical protein
MLIMAGCTYSRRAALLLPLIDFFGPSSAHQDECRGRSTRPEEAFVKKKERRSLRLKSSFSYRAP